MGFWNRNRPEQPDATGNPLDRATKALAISASRRNFLKQLSIGGAAVGLGLTASVRPARAQVCTYAGSCDRRSCIPCVSTRRLERKIYGNRFTCDDGTEYCEVYKIINGTCGSC